MEILIGGIKTNVGLVTINDGLNFSRFSEIPPSQIIEFELQMEISELISLIEDEYIRVRDEIKQDDIQFNDTSEFSQTGYCSLEDLLNFQRQFTDIIRNYLDREIYSRILTTAGKSQFIINSTDTVKIKNNEILLSGRAIIKENFNS